MAVTGAAVVIAGVTYYLCSDKTNFVRADCKQDAAAKFPLIDDERKILFLASLAPSGHNTQPWFVKYIEPYHWIICNDRTKWLSAVDPTQRETILSIGAFIQNLEYAASNAGYNCQFDMMATTKQDEDMVAVKLIKSAGATRFDIVTMKSRRIVRTNYMNDVLKKEDEGFLFSEERKLFNFIHNGSKEYQYLNEQTIEANKIQSYRDAAESELSDWMRFSSRDAEKKMDGLTTASMEIEGVAGFVVRNF